VALLIGVILLKKLEFVSVYKKEELRKCFYEYLIEISEYDSNVKFDDEGVPTYQYYYLYWQENNRYPIYFKIDNNIAGFALVREDGCRSYEIAEFCVFKEFRKDNNALFFASLLIELFDGEFNFSTSINNLRAIRFWDKFTSSFCDKKVREDKGYKSWNINSSKFIKHSLGLQPLHYENIRSGKKIYEGRLNDEKRQLFNIGDKIEILKDPNRDEAFEVIIVNKFFFSNFENMVDSLELSKLGFDSCCKEEVVSVYHEFYSLENIEKYGVVVFEVQVIE